MLKVLDELRVPIDAIAGTSMGAVVGGLYATGFSAQDIERIVSTLDWQDAFKDRPPRAELTFRRKLEDQNFLVKFPLGLRSGRFLLPKGLIQGQKLNQTLRKLTLPVARITDFDRAAHAVPRRRDRPRDRRSGGDARRRSHQRRAREPFRAGRVLAGGARRAGCSSTAAFRRTCRSTWRGR